MDTYEMTGHRQAAPQAGTDALGGSDPPDRHLTSAWAGVQGRRQLRACVQIVGMLAVVLAGSGAALACTPLPYNLTNGSPADATQVMGDFDGILACPLFTGSVGITTTAPQAKLDIQTSGTTNAGSAWDGHWLRLGEPNALGSNSSGIGLGYDTTNEVAYLAAVAPSLAWRPLHIDGSQVVFNTSSGGNVGIGTISPLKHLHVVGANGSTGITPTNTNTVAVFDNSAQAFIQLLSATNNSSGILFGDTGSGGGAYGQVIYSQSTNAMSFATSSATAVTINASGSVGIGTTTPSMTLYVNGQAGGTAAWSNVSDARLKGDVVEIQDALNLLEQLRGVRFHWLPTDKRSVGEELALPVDEPQVGFIAQEVGRVIPEAVTAPKPGSSGVYSLKDTVLIPVMLEAIKEQQAEIVALKGEVAELRLRK
jgi:Chaperone of endosialidase